MFLWVVPYFDEPVGQQIKCKKSVAVLHQQILMPTSCQDCFTNETRTWKYMQYIMQMSSLYASDFRFQQILNMQTQYKKMFGKRVMVHTLSQ